MRIVLFAVLASLSPALASAQDVVPPEVVRLESTHVDGDVKTVNVGNANKQYSLTCVVKAAGCITPKAEKDYWLFDKATRWKMPGAKDFITLSFLQDWTVAYNAGENIALVDPDNPTNFGVFLLDTTGGGYEQDTLISDGPIIYGTGLSDEDRHKAWQHFFMQMAEACARQQGTDACGVKLARRCLPGQDFCMIALDANLVGIGGIQEPRKVMVLVASDVHDPHKQISRWVCTWPENWAAKDKQVCRDWDTGQLMTGESGQ